MNLETTKNQSKDISLATIKKDAFLLQNITNQTDELCLAAVQSNGVVLKYVNNQSEEICLQAVKQNGYALEYVEQQTDKICLVAVSENGYVLRYVKKQNNAICVAAVEFDGLLLVLVKEQTFEVCLAAVKAAPLAIVLVEQQIPEICSVAIAKENWLLKYVKNKKFFIQEVVVNEKFDTDEAGWLEESFLWKGQFAESCAQQDGDVLSPMHWRLICFIRIVHNGSVTSFSWRALKTELEVLLGQKTADEMIACCFSRRNYYKISKYAGLTREHVGLIRNVVP